MFSLAKLNEYSSIHSCTDFRNIQISNDFLQNLIDFTISFVQRVTAICNLHFGKFGEKNLEIH